VFIVRAGYATLCHRRAARLCGVTDPAQRARRRAGELLVKLRMADCLDYMRHLTDWERERTLDV
jgi:hypothetical protein